MRASSKPLRPFGSRSEACRGWGYRLAGLLALLVVVCGVDAAPAADLKTGAFSPPRAAPEFSLLGSDGSPLTLRRYRGKVVALGFGYSSCPDVCPTTLFLLAQAKTKLGAAANNFQVVYVTVDPERDTVSRLQKFLAAYDSTFVGGTGAPEQLAAVRKDYGIQISKEPSRAGDPSVYAVHHSSFVYLIDTEGKLRAMMPFGVTVDDIVHDVKSLLRN